MHANRLSSYSSRLLELAQAACSPLEAGAGRRYILFGVAFTLLDDAADKYDGLLKDLLRREHWERKFSTGYISSRLGDILIAAVTGEVVQAERMWSDLVNEVESFSREFTVYIPVSGIDLRVPELSLGGIKLISVSQPLRDEMMHQFDFGSPKTIEDMGPVWAGARCVAEPRRAFELGEEKLRRVLDLFRYTILFARKRPAPPRRINVGLQGEMSRTTRASLAVCCDSRYNVNQRTGVGPLHDFVVDNQTIEFMSEIGAFEIATLLDREPDSLNDFEEPLLRAFHWVANAQTQDEPENELLNLVTALEVFFTKRGGDPITAAIAEGVALVLGNDLQERRQLNKRVRQLYGKRSDV